MSQVLEKLLLKFDGTPHEEIISQTRKIYVEAYCAKGVTLHDGAQLIFEEDRFNHAFYDKPEGKKWTSSEKQIFAHNRAARVRWIGEIVSGNIPNVQCFKIPPTPNNPASRRQRLYVYWTHPYMIWMFENSDNFVFSSAYDTFALRARTKLKENKASMIWWK